MPPKHSFGEEEVVDNAVDFFAHISIGSDGTVPQVDEDSQGDAALYSPETLHRSWQEAITDIGIVLEDKNEPLPDGYEVVRETLGGEKANLNYGSYRRHTIMLCVRRRKHSRSCRHVVDVAVCCSHETVPEGFEKISRSVTGAYDANISRSKTSVMSTTYLCVKYSTTTTATATSRKRVAAKEQKKASDDTHGGGGGDGDDDDEDEEQYHTERSVAEVAVFLPGKGERVPGDFVERGVSFNRGFGATQVFVALKFGPRLGICDLPFRPEVLDRLPRRPLRVHRDMGQISAAPLAALANERGGAGGGGERSDEVEVVDFPQALPMFCFPRGIRLKRASRFAQPAPSAFNFVFTENDGRHVFVACLIFYEEVQKDAVAQLLRRYRHVQSFDFDERHAREDDNDNDDGDGGSGGEGGSAAAKVSPGRLFGRASHFMDRENMRVWVPHCICLSSHWPIYAPLRVALQHLWSFSLSKCRVPLEQHLAAILGIPMYVVFVLALKAFFFLFFPTCFSSLPSWFASVFLPSFLSFLPSFLSFFSPFLSIPACLIRRPDTKASSWRVAGALAAGPRAREHVGGRDAHARAHRAAAAAAAWASAHEPRLHHADALALDGPAARRLHAHAQREAAALPLRFLHALDGEHRGAPVPALPARLPSDVRASAPGQAVALPRVAHGLRHGDGARRQRVRQRVRLRGEPNADGPAAPRQAPRGPQQRRGECGRATALLLVKVCAL